MTTPSIKTPLAPSSAQSSSHPGALVTHAEFRGKRYRIEAWSNGQPLDLNTLSPEQKTEIEQNAKNLFASHTQQLEAQGKTLPKAIPSEITPQGPLYTQTSRNPLPKHPSGISGKTQRVWNRLAPSPPASPRPLKPIKNMVISGGGAKGSVLPGAFEVFYRDHPDFMQNLERIAGSSVGAITAALIATGISLEDLNAINDQNFLELLGPEKFGKPAIGLTQFIRKTIETNISRYLKNLSPEQLAELKKDPDLFLVIDRLEKNRDLPPITFKILSRLHQHAPETFKHLSITATEKTRGLFIFDEDSAPGVEIAMACRASASIPILFEPVTMPLVGFSSDTPQGLTIWGTTPPIFFDGAMTDNVPVKEIERRYVAEGKNPRKNKFFKREARRETVVLVFEKSNKEGTSAFDPSSDKAPYSPSWGDYIKRDLLLPLLSGLKLLRPNTQAKAKTLNHIKKKCPHIISFQTPLKTVHFAQAQEPATKATSLKIGRLAAEKFFLSRTPPAKDPAPLPPQNQRRGKAPGHRSASHRLKVPQL
ncbi:MAG: patatin-like phospholipase family protein [Chlamydiales bacterium]|nr:patatin-like phospholipase family protein [Chlamydiales bacterium]